MNKQLMIHVERIVRPVRAGGKRKLRMRRELLAHLEAAVEEERLHCPDDAVAIERAASRLGRPADITAELQESVHWFERMMNSPLREPCLGTVGPMRITLIFAMLIAAGLALHATLGLVFALTGLNFVLMDGRVYLSLLGLNIYASCINWVWYGRLARAIVAGSQLPLRRAIFVTYVALLTLVQTLPGIVMYLSGQRPPDGIEVFSIAIIAAGSAAVAVMIDRTVSRMPPPESNKWADLDLGNQPPQGV